MQFAMSVPLEGTAFGGHASIADFLEHLAAAWSFTVVETRLCRVALSCSVRRRVVQDQ